MTVSIEAAARAAYEAHGGPHAWNWSRLHEPEREAWCNAVRAALAAVRVPSEAMLDAATTSQERRDLFAVQWTYAIDALLSEGDTRHGDAR